MGRWLHGGQSISYIVEALGVKINLNKTAYKEE
jgi:hypothetical protein